jgi:ABC-type transporter Mla MlaB component
MGPTSGLRTFAVDVSGLAPEAPTVDALARLQLQARRCGCRLALCEAPPELLELVTLMGLADVLPTLPSVSAGVAREIPLS